MPLTTSIIEPKRQDEHFLLQLTPRLKDRFSLAIKNAKNFLNDKNPKIEKEEKTEKKIDENFLTEIPQNFSTDLVISEEKKIRLAYPNLEIFFLSSPSTKYLENFYFNATNQKKSEEIFQSQISIIFFHEEILEDFSIYFQILNLAHNFYNFKAPPVPLCVFFPSTIQKFQNFPLVNFCYNFLPSVKLTAVDGKKNAEEIAMAIDAFLDRSPPAGNEFFDGKKTFHFLKDDLDDFEKDCFYLEKSIENFTDLQRRYAGDENFKKEILLSGFFTSVLKKISKKFKNFHSDLENEKISKKNLKNENEWPNLHLCKKLINFMKQINEINSQK